MNLDINMTEIDQGFIELRRLEAVLHAPENDFDTRLASVERALDFIERMRQYLTADGETQVELLNPDQSRSPFK